MNTLDCVARKDLEAAANFHLEMGLELEEAKALLAYLARLGYDVKEPGQKWSDLSKRYYEVERVLNDINNDIAFNIN